jgi:hypothetical protein
MNVTREEAAQALSDINRASDRIVQLKGYHHGAPFFILWGLVWLFANTLSQFQPELRNWAWGIGVTAGAVLSTIIGVMQARKTTPDGAKSFNASIGRRIGITSGIMLVFIVVITWIANPESSRDVNTIISIFFPFIYMAAGVWAGWRLFAIGLVTAAAILAGYVWVQEYFELWMGVFAGGSLIAGGLWLRSA